MGNGGHFSTSTQLQLCMVHLVPLCIVALACAIGCSLGAFPTLVTTGSTPKSVRKATSLTTGIISTKISYKKQGAALLTRTTNMFPRLRSVKALPLTRVQFSSFPTSNVD